uniref:TNFR-Cys domain-containing protein n=1 Tax=Pygocentrus nattereri TaxID=42514 RepID=A0AAR2KMY0_PYGNA
FIMTRTTKALQPCIGLRMQQECRSNADTVCEPQSGYYCVETHDKTCRTARQHSTCLLGQYINKTAEYEIDGQCCPMCTPGYRVYKHCTVETSTTCVSCHDSTFIDAPNGLIDCFSCTVCDSGQGLRVKIPCTQSSDTVCEPLDECYCIEQHRGGCIQAVKHTKCSTGQYIKHKGTTFKDTECAECADGTFSDGSFQTCQPHSKCEDLGLKEIKAGTHSSDAECGNKTPVLVLIELNKSCSIYCFCVYLCLSQCYIAKQIY